MEDYSDASRRSLFDRFFGYLDRRKPSDRALFLLVVLILVSAISYTIFAFNRDISDTTPTSGGTYTEGIIGTPRFVNPVLAITRADHDLVALVYSGLLRLSSDGTLTEDLAESVTISEDGTVYNIVLKEGLTFHDGAPLSAEDVSYTIGLIQSAELKSPLRGNWSGVSIETLGERELNLVLAEAYTPFIENLTLGILPKHIWSALSLEELPFSQHNTEPIGSGPYQITDVKRNQSGLSDTYTLTAYTGNGKTPNIETFVFSFYQNETDLADAFATGNIMGSAALPLTVARDLGEQYQQQVQTLPRVFSIFINQNKTAALRDPAVREALSVVIDREALINEVLEGYGQSTQSPIPTEFLALESRATTTDIDRFATARAILTDAGWEITDAGTWIKEIEEVETTLAIDLATANTDVFAKTAGHLETTWRQLGVEVSVAQFEQSDLVQAIIRPRDYQALLFGTDIGRSLDLYPFWHSSQRADPGLNVALYTSITADDVLEDIRVTQDPAERQDLLGDVLAEIEADMPAIFLFSPSLVYAVHESVTTVPVDRLSVTSERLSTVDQWYMREESLWPIFLHSADEETNE